MCYQVPAKSSPAKPEKTVEAPAEKMDTEDKSATEPEAKPQDPVPTETTPAVVTVTPAVAIETTSNGQKDEAAKPAETADNKVEEVPVSKKPAVVEESNVVAPPPAELKQNGDANNSAAENGV